MVYPLNELDLRDTTEVVWIISDSLIFSQLDVLSFTFRKRIICILGNHRDSMNAHLIHDTLIALRTENVKKALIRTLESPSQTVSPYRHFLQLTAAPT